MKVFLSVLAVCIVGALADPIVKVGFPGKCPTVPFVTNFVSKEFVGKWFAAKETGKDIPCVSYDLKEIRPGHYHADMLPKKVTIDFDQISTETFDEGLKVEFKVNPYMDGGKAFVFATDYENYAGIFICKEDQEKEVHYQTISYWSKVTTMSDEYVQLLDDVLAKYPEIDVTKLRVVKHDECDAVVEAVVEPKIPVPSEPIV